MHRRGAADSSDATGPSKPEVEEADRFTPGLYLVATPIGNLRDISLRALDLLRAADIVACEDTRVTARLLRRYGIATPTASYHEYNAARAGPRLIERLKGGAIVALVSDAGTPLVSDPGYRLVQRAIEAGVTVTALPGPSSVLAALTLAGLPTDRFLFAGFLPAKQVARRQSLAELAGIGATLVLLEAPHRLPDTLADLAAILGPRPAAVARELTKRFEEVRRGSLETLAAHYAEHGPPKGEVTVVIGPPAEPGAASDAELDEALDRALAGMSLREAAAAVAGATGRPRREVYARALARRQQD